MKPYSILNTDRRRTAHNDFENDLYKLMNNAVFGKTMENVRRRINIKLYRDEEEEDSIVNAIAKPTYVRHVLFENRLVGVENKKTKVTLCKPVYVGMCVLELSKELMYRFYHLELKARYGDRVHLLYTDTDSLVLQFNTEDLYADMDVTLDLYDTSNFPTDHRLRSDTNIKVVGKFKDEVGGKLMSEFVALRSKMHCYDGEECGRRAKGVKKTVTRKFTIQDYRQCLQTKKVTQYPMTNLLEEPSSYHLHRDHHQAITGTVR